MGFILFTCALSLLIAASLMKGVESGFFGRFSAWVKGMRAVPRLALFVMCVAGMAYSQKPGTFTLFLNALFSSPQTLEEGLPVVGLHETMLDADEDGLADGVEMTGLLPVYDETANAGALIAGAARDWSLMWPYGVSAAVKEVALGMDFPFGGQSYSNIWLSATGLFSFDAPLNRAVPMLYPQGLLGKERLAVKIPQLAFLQGKTALHPSLGSDIWFDDSVAGVRQFAFDKIFLGSTTNVWVDALVEFHDNGAVRLAWVRSDEAAVNSAHTIGWQSTQTKGWDTLVGGVTLGEVASGSVVWLMPFTPTDPSNPDSDGDGGSDGDELIRFGTDPMVVDVDSDGDGFVDALEILLGTDPFDPLSYPDAALLALDSDGDGWADYLERILGSDPDEAVLKPNTFGSGICTLTLAPAETGAGASTLVCGGRLYPVLPETESVTIYTSFGEILPINWVGTPRAVIGAMGGNGTMAFSHVEASAQPMMMTFSATPPRISEVALARVALFTSGEEAEKACIHPKIGKRYIEAVINQLPFGILNETTFNTTQWSWSQENAHPDRTFSKNGATCSLGMALSDDEALGALTFTATVETVALQQSWVAQEHVNATIPVGRCPDAEEEDPEVGGGEEDGDGDGEEEPYPPEYPPYCITHERLKTICETEMPPPTDCGTNTNVWCEVHLREKATCEADETIDYPADCEETPDSNAWCAVHERPIRLCREETPEEECEPVTEIALTQRYRVLELNDTHYPNLFYSLDIVGAGRRGSCCGCIDHGPNGTEYAAQNLTHTSGLYCYPTGDVPYRYLPGTLSGTAPSTNLFDYAYAYEIPQNTIISNNCTVGRLRLEPALSRESTPTEADIRAWDTLRKAKRAMLTLPAVNGTEIALTLRTDIALSEGYFSLTFTGTPGSFEIERDIPLLLEDPPPALTLTPGQTLDIPTADWLGQTYQMDGAVPFIIRVKSGGLARLTYTYTAQSEHGLVVYTDTMLIKTLSPALLPDYDRNGLWDQIDLAAAKNAETYRFWVNDDGDGMEERSDIPQTEDEKKDAEDSLVNGERDWVDFFAVKLNLKETLKAFPAASHRYTLTSDNAVNVWVPSLTPEGAALVAASDRPWLNTVTFMTTYYPETRQNARAVVRVTESPIELTEELLNAIAEESIPHALLLEGRKRTVTIGNSPLKLTVVEKRNANSTVYRDELPVVLSGVEEMFTYKNFLTSTGVGNKFIGNWYKPLRAAWGQDENQQLILAHGYNVNPNQARSWGSEMFKRFYAAGSMAQFTMVVWHGYETQGDLIIADLPPDYHRNVRNAFDTSRDLALWLRGLKQEHPSAVISVMGHSLGNVLMSSALFLHSASQDVDHYFGLNAAAALEAYYAAEEKGPNMVHSAWRPYVAAGQERLLSSEWHTLFPTNDVRRTLTWRGLFENNRGKTQFHQYYSSGDEVVAIPPADHYSIIAIGSDNDEGLPNKNSMFVQYAWAVQELWKGCGYELWGDWDIPEDNPWYAVWNITYRGKYGGSTLMGWGFNTLHYRNLVGNTPENGIIPFWFWQPYSPAGMASVSDEELKTTPLFRSNPSDLFSSNDQASREYAYANRLGLLAKAIPSRTYSMGSKALDIEANVKTRLDMNNEKNSWFRPENEYQGWRHSDIRDMPYVNVKDVFEQLLDTVKGRNK